MNSFLVLKNYCTTVLYCNTFLIYFFYCFLGNDLIHFLSIVSLLLANKLGDMVTG